MLQNLQMSSGSLYIKDEYIGPANLEIPPLDLADPPEYIRSIHFPLSSSAEFTMEAEIGAPAYRRLMGFDVAPFPDATGFSMIFSQPYQVQRRRHKKKRINKKWAKRYGYVTKFKKYRMDEVYFKDTGTGEYDFYTKNIEVVK